MPRKGSHFYKTMKQNLKGNPPPLIIWLASATKATSSARTAYNKYRYTP